MMALCIAFDCFNTVFDVSTLTRQEKAHYFDHVSRNDFSPYHFSPNWWALKLHPDSCEGIALLQSMRYVCVALSNGTPELIRHVSERQGVRFDHIVDLVAHEAYKPNNIEAYRTVQKDLGIPTTETIMVTANPKFGDVEGATMVGMRPVVIRHGFPETIIDLARMLQEQGDEFE